MSDGRLPVADLGRLAWQCRRGMRELDELLLAFLNRGYGELDAAGRADFERLLSMPDPILLPWLLGQNTPADPALIPVVRAVRAAQTDPGRW